MDYFGVFSNMTKALNFDENIREEALIDWDKLKATVPGEVARCMESFKGIKIADTRECLLAALRASGGVRSVCVQSSPVEAVSFFFMGRISLDSPASRGIFSPYCVCVPA